MYFDFEGWRCQIRNRVLKIPSVNTLWLPDLNVPKTEFWFFHVKCGSYRKGKTRSHPPHNKQRGWRVRNGYQIRWCQSCGKEMPWNVLDYFAKALELWRISAP